VSEHPGKRLPIRRMVRERALQLLYQADMTTGSEETAPPEVTHALAADDLTGLKPKELRKIQRQADELASGVRDDREDIDAILNSVSTHWDLRRMLAIDRNVMRIAVYEMRRGDPPPIVAINEAVDIAKRFGGEDSGSFVNGVLDRIHREQFKEMAK
jgi:N utilization substance protein B